MERLLRLVVTRPIGVALTLLALLGLGVLSLLRMPVSAMPAVSRPTVRVQAEVPNAGMEHLEQVLARRLEQRLLVLAGADRVSCWCRDGLLAAEVAFTWGVSGEEARLAVSEAVDGLSSEQLPIAWQVRTTPPEQPALQLLVEGSQPLAVRTAVAEDLLTPALAAIPGVTRVQLLGGERLRTVVRPDPDRLAACAVQPGVLRATLAEQLHQRWVAEVDLDGEQIQVLAAGTGTSPGRLAALAVPRSIGGTVGLGELATVRQEPWPEHGMLRLAGRPAVGLAVWLAPEANALQVDRQLTTTLGSLQGRLVDGVELVRAADNLARLRAALLGLLVAAVLGAMVAGLALTLFFRRPAALVLLVLVIPVSLWAALPAFQILGLGLNLVSLAGMALAAGMLVDAAVVVLSSCLAPGRRGTGVERVVAGTSAVTRAILASAVTTVVVFLPALSLQHLAATLFRQLAIAVMLTLLCSLLLALLALPVAAARLAPSPHRGEGAIRRRYRRLLSRVMARPGWAVLPLLLCLLLCLAAGSELPQQLLAAESATAVEIAFVVPAAAPGSEPLPGTTALLAPLRRDGEQDLLWFVPEPISGPPLPGGGWRLPGARSTAELQLLQDALRSAVPGLAVRRAGPAGSVLEALPLRRVTVEISGRERAGVTAATERISSLLRRAGLPVLADLPPAVATIELRPTPLGQRLANDLERRLAAALPAPVSPDLGQVRLDEGLLARADLGGLPVSMADGITRPLAVLAEPTEKLRPALLVRHDGQPAQRLVVGEATADVSDVERRLAAALAELSRSSQPLPAGVVVQTGGGAADWRQARSELLLAALLGLVLVVLVLAAVYESLRLPLVVLAVLPFAVLGGLVAQRLAGGGLDLGSGLGLVLLIGLSVNNGVLLLDRLRGCDASPTAWARRAAGRLQPVLVTTLTTLATLAPIALIGGAGSSLRVTLARTVLAGLALSTPAALLVLPPLARLVLPRTTTRAEVSE